MARGATKASDNVWYQARMEAAKVDERLQSRCGVAEILNMSEDAVKNTELGIEKCMPVDKAVMFAKLYNAPQLLNHYCLHECPIGKGKARTISDEVVPIDRVTVKLLKLLKVNRLKEVQDKLLDIAAEGNVTEEDRPELESIMEYLDTVVKTVSELRTICRKATKE